MPFIVVGGILGYLVLVPIVMLLLSSVRPTGMPGHEGATLDHYRAIYGNLQTYELILTTLVFAVGSTLLALTIGLTLAWLVERTDMPGRGVFRLLIILPMAMPPMLLAMAWSLLLSPQIGFFNTVLGAVFNLGSAPLNIYTMWGMILVQGLAFVPTVFLTMGPSIRNMDPSLEEAATVSGARTYVILRRVILPLVAPALLAVAVYLVTVGMVVFDIPGTLGTPGGITVLSSAIVLRAKPTVGLPAYGEIGALSVFFLLLLTALSAVYYRAIRRGQKRYATITGKGYRPRAFALGRWRRPAAGLALAYVGMAIILPMGILLWTSLLPYYTGVSMSMVSQLSFDNHLTLLTTSTVRGAARNSLVIAVVASTVAAVLAAITSWVVIRSRTPGRNVLDRMAFAPLAIPSVLLGLALIHVYLTVPIPIYGSIWIIGIAHLTNYFPFSTRVTNGVMLQIHRDLEDAAHTSGATWLRTFRKVLLPLALPAMFAVWLWVAAHSARELSAALMLQGRNNAVIATLLWDYWNRGRPTAAAAVGVWLIVALTFMVGGWYVMSKRFAKRL